MGFFGFFQADEMEIRSFGERPLIMGGRRSDGKVFKTPIPGDSALEFKSALKAADREIGPILNLMTDEQTSYPQATEWLGITHYPVNRMKQTGEGTTVDVSGDVYHECGNKGVVKPLMPVVVMRVIF